jgi:polyisoprenoid-binding protein YceI
MKKIIFIFSLLIVITALSACTTNNKTAELNNSSSNSQADVQSMIFTALADGPYQIQTENSSLTWKANKVLAAHTGLVTIKFGQININDGKLSNADFVMDMTTITSDEGIDSLVKHLKSADFFNVDEYPEARLGVNFAVPGDLADEYIMSGDLTIKGITKPINFRAVVNPGSDSLNARAEIIIDRLDWDIRYRSGKFFQDLGDNLISDEISFIIDLNASKIE